MSSLPRIRCRKGRRNQNGFTFVELIVAVFIFSVIVYSAFIGIKTASDMKSMADESMQRFREIQHAVDTLSRDLHQLTPRPVRDQLGDGYVAALHADQRTLYLLELTRAGWSNHIGFPRGTLQRVAYRLEEDKLFRDHQVVLDSTLANEPVKTELLTGIENIEIRFLDSSNQWQHQWPPLSTLDGSGPAVLRMRPVAVEFLIELEDLGEITRLIEIAG